MVTGRDEPRMVSTPGCDASVGQVRWSVARSIWTGGMTLGAFAALFVTPSLGGFAAFLGLTAVTIGLGHSLGMHRLLIHRSYETSRWLEYVLVYLGVLVGMAGPIGMIRIHDLRDWAQRQAECHDYFGHRRAFWIDWFWQNYCRIELDSVPQFELETVIGDDPIYRFLERSWMLQQIPVAIVLFLLGGWGWVLWGVCMRVTVSLYGHWLIGHFAHRSGHQNWSVPNAAVQGYNIPWAALFSFGESWHSNHHAFPASARLGMKKGEWDPGWWTLKALEAAGLVHRLQEPDDQTPRAKTQLRTV